MKASLTVAQIAKVVAARPPAMPIFKQILREVKPRFGITEGHRLRVECDDRSSRKFGLCIRKKTGDAYAAPAQTHPTFYPMTLAEALATLTPLADKPARGPALAVDVDGSTISTGNRMGVDTTKAFIALQGAVKKLAGARFTDLQGVNRADDQLAAGLNGYFDGHNLWIPVHPA